MTALQVFCAVVDAGSFAGAARRMRLSPAAVSKNIRELEADLGVRLLHRTTRRMSLSEAGVIYHDRVQRALTDLGEAASIVGAHRDAPSGRLKVSAPMTVTLECLSERVPAFLARYPDISLDLQLDDRRVDLIEGGYDLAVRGTARLEDSSLVARKLLRMDHVVCGAPSYFAQHGTPARPEDLRGHHCIKFPLSEHAHTWTFREAGGRGATVAQPVQGRYEVTSSLAIRDALRAGLGLSLIPEIYVRDDLAAGRLVTVLDGWEKDHATLYAVYPTRHFVAPKVRVFVEFLQEAFGSD